MILAGTKAWLNRTYTRHVRAGAGAIGAGWADIDQRGIRWRIAGTGNGYWELGPLINTSSTFTPARI